MKKILVNKLNGHIISSSELNKLKKWLIISLADINLNLDQDYELTVSENDFLIKNFLYLELRVQKAM